MSGNRLTFVRTRKSAVVGVGLILCLLTTLALLPFPEIFDRPITTFMNTHIVGSPLADVLIAAIAHLYMLSGVLFLSGIWYCWLSSNTETRARLLSGTLAAISAAAFSRFLQHVLPSHHRPLHDPEFSIHLPSVVDPNSFNAWNAFPSDHAVAWFGLAMVILIARPRLGLLALIWAFATLVPRNYLGLHYPTDIIGGAALGSLAVWLSQSEVLQWLPRRVVGWGDRHIPIFYTGAFFMSYQISTLFDDVRALAGNIAKILHVAPI